jgi:hypothetical protein
MNKQCKLKYHKKFFNAVLKKLESIDKDLNFICDVFNNEESLDITAYIYYKREKIIAMILSSFDKKNDYIYINKLDVDEPYRKNKLGNILMCIVIYTYIEINKIKNQIKYVKLHAADNYTQSDNWKKIMEKIYRYKKNKIKLKKMFDTLASEFKLVNWYNRDFNFEIDDVDVSSGIYLSMKVPIEKIIQKCDILF